MTHKTISIVVPIYNEEEVLDYFFEAIEPILKSCQENYNVGFKFVFIDDGSQDRSYEMLKIKKKQDERVQVVKFSRNFGKELATTAGIDFADGDAVIFMDVDLQDNVSSIPEMIQSWKEGYEVVLPIRKDRDDSFFKKLTSYFFYWLINKLSVIEIPQNAGDFRLIDRKVVEVLKLYKENNRFMRGIFASVGFKIKYIFFERPARVAGSTKYNYFKMIAYALEGITGFSTALLKIWTYLGTIVAFSSFVYGIYIIVEALLIRQVPKGYPSMMVVILFLGGIQLISMGVLGEYVARLYLEAKKRPLYIVSETQGFN